LPHSIVIDSRDRLLVADRTNKRIQIFDQDGTFLDQWTQFGSPSGLFIAPDDTLYAVDFQNKKSLFIGSAKDGSIRYQIEDLTLAEGIAVDPAGTIYVGETLPGQIGEMATGSTVRKLIKR
jgi:sugar lactone lactonase YvrE